MSQISRRQLLVGAGAATTLALAGCGGGSDDSTDLSGNKVDAMKHFGVGDQFKAAKPVTFSIMMLSNPGYPYKKNWLFFSELAKRTNVSFDSTVVPYSDYNQKRSVMISGGDAPMIIPKTYHPDEQQYVAGGAILPVSEYVDLMPNYQDKVKRWNLAPNLDTYRQEDGRYYLLPGLHEQPWQDYTLAMRYDILDKLKLDVPQSWDDVHDVLKAMKTLLPDSYPFSDRWSVGGGPGQPGANNLLSILSIAYGTYAGWSWQPAYFDTGAGKFVFPGAMDEYRQMLQFLHTLVKEGLLDPESFTQQDDQAIQKFSSGKSYVISTNAQEIVNSYRPGIAKIHGATVKKIPLPTGPTGAVVPGVTRLENGVMISSKARDSKNFVAMMQFVDWLWYSDAGEVFARWGIKGKTYTGDPLAGKLTLAPDVTWAGINPTGKKNLQVDYGFYNGVFSYGGSTKLLDTQFTAEELEFQKLMNQRRTLPVPPPYPFTADEREQASLWETNLGDYVGQQTLKFILGKRPFSDWSTYLSELKGQNMTNYIDLVNKAYQRFKNKHG
jgi:putative aldouronate transport system substrate-binding protein